MGIDLIEKAPAPSEADKPTTGIHSEAPIDYAAAAQRYAVEATDPTLSPLEVQAKQDIVTYAAKRAKELAKSNQGNDSPSDTPTPEA